MWFAGYRMQFFAEKGLAPDISDVWEKIGGNFSDAMKKASTGRGRQAVLRAVLLLPVGGLLPEERLRAARLRAATNLDEFRRSCKQMQKDGLVPIAFGDKDGWPAMGTFD